MWANLVSQAMKLPHNFAALTDNAQKIEYVVTIFQKLFFRLKSLLSIKRLINAEFGNRQI